jgi:hypothetical protein
LGCKSTGYKGNMSVFKQRQETCDRYNDSHACNCGRTDCKDWKCGAQAVQGQFLLIPCLIWWFTFRSHKLLWPC